MASDNAAKARSHLFKNKGRDADVSVLQMLCLLSYVICECGITAQNKLVPSVRVVGSLHNDSDSMTRRR